ncbi:MAG TPA: CNNM domain-containing protein [Verrucomicrobiae bacterium]|jgi:CBS domain containing-hemolysin-like protein|nr:CNNM domain-containing protein [Verrucomicrobiae bacterium]
MDANLFNWSVLVLALMLAFLLSGMEAGVFALNRLRVRRLARAGQPSAKLLNNFLEKPEKFLWTILVGNTLANFLVLGFALAKIHEWFFGQRAAEIVFFAIAVFLFYTFFDLLPKMFFRASPNQLCLSAARIFRLVNFTLSPLVSIVEGVSQTILRVTGGRTFTGRLFGNREEMRAVMQESAQSLTSDERAMINRVLDLQNFTVGQIATPLAQTVTLEMHTPVGEALKLAREEKFSRLPVWETREGRPRVAGLLMVGPLLFRDDLDLQKPVAGHMTPALFLGEDTRLEIALRRVQRAGERLAVILARDGKEIGIVTLEDILKTMFGEMKL